MKVQAQALLLCIWVILHLILASPSIADEPQDTPEQAIKDAQNPITDRSSVPILNSTGFGAGPFDRTSSLGLDFNDVLRKIHLFKEQQGLMAYMTIAS